MKNYIATVTITNGEYETLTNYCFKSTDREAAEKEVEIGYEIGGDNWEQQAELYRLEEVTDHEYAILTKYV